MKKFLALILCLLMALSMTSAVAEEAPTQVEDLYEGSWIQFEGAFEMYVPADWMVLEPTAEMIEKGIFYILGTDGGACQCYLSWKPLDEATTIEETQAALATVFPSATLYDINGIGMVGYIDEAHNQLVYVVMDALEPGMYMITFYPGTDPDFQMMASLIVSSIRPF